MPMDQRSIGSGIAKQLQDSIPFRMWKLKIEMMPSAHRKMLHALVLIKDEHILSRVAGSDGSPIGERQSFRGLQDFPLAIFFIFCRLSKSTISIQNMN